MMGDYFLRIVDCFYNTGEDWTRKKDLVWNILSSMDHLLLWYYVGGVALGWVILMVLSYFPGMYQCVCVFESVCVSCRLIIRASCVCWYPILFFLAHMLLWWPCLSCVVKKKNERLKPFGAILCIFIMWVLFWNMMIVRRTTPGL
jgi:hypothetical protein